MYNKNKKLKKKL